MLDFSKKKKLDLEIFAKSLQISPKSNTDIFLKNDSNNFFGFWPEVSTKCDLQFEWNLFFWKICNFEIFGLEIVPKKAQIDVFHHFLDFALLVFLDFAQAGMSSCFLTIRRSSQYILVLSQILLHN